VDTEEAVLQVQQGNIEAFNGVIANCHLTIRYFVARRIPDDTEGEEIVHKTFITAFEKLKEYRTEQSFIPWLRGIALNHCRNAWRTKGRESRLRGQLLEVKRAELNLDQIETQTEDDLPRSEALKYCMQALPSSEQQLIHLRFVDDLTVAAIASTIDKKSEAVRHHLFRIRRRLRDCLAARLLTESRQ